MIPEMDRLTGYQPYMFMQDGARSHTANETVRFLNQQRYLTLLQPNMLPLTVQILIQLLLRLERSGAKCLPRKKI